DRDQRAVLYSAGLAPRPAASPERLRVRRRRGKPAAHQPDADAVHQLRYLSAGHLPVAQLRTTNMAEPYIGEIRCFGFSFATFNWARCDGQLLSIANFNALFSILGTTYGGDGQTTFALPNLQGRIPMHWGNGPGGFNTAIGESQGVEQVTLIAGQMPVHNHTINAASAASGGGVISTNVPGPTALIGPSAPDGVYNKAPPAIDAPFSPKAISIAGGSLPHENRQPFLVLNFCIALNGLFPSRN